MARFLALHCHGCERSALAMTSYHERGMSRKGESQPEMPDQTGRRERSPIDRVVASWRRLTGGSGVRDEGRRTLLACSGGADSAALSIALASAKPSVIVLAYVSHDIRDAGKVLEEREQVRALAKGLGCGWATAAVAVAGQAGNLEGRARRDRYKALACLAASAECRFIATGHQATDQLETVLMRLMRGAGPAGLRGIRERRVIADESGVKRIVVRPMLSVTRQESEAICVNAGYVPTIDATNADEALLRNALRVQVIPALSMLAPGVERRTVQTARLAADACQIMQEATAEASKRCRVKRSGDAATWDRKALQRESASQLRLMLWSTLRQLATHPDRVDMAAIEPLVVAIRGEGEHRKVWTISDVLIEMTTREVSCVKLK